MIFLFKVAKHIVIVLERSFPWLMPHCGHVPAVSDFELNTSDHPIYFLIWTVPTNLPSKVCFHYLLFKHHILENTQLKVTKKPLTAWPRHTHSTLMLLSHVSYFCLISERWSDLPGETSLPCYLPPCRKWAALKVGFVNRPLSRISCVARCTH